MPRSSDRSKRSQAQTTPLASPANKPAEPAEAHVIDPKDHETALARVAELEGELSAQKAQLAEASADVATSAAKEKAAAEVAALGLARLEAERGKLESQLVAVQQTMAADASRAELDALKAKRAHEEALKAAVQEQAVQGAEALRNCKEESNTLHASMQQTLQELQTERNLLAERNNQLAKQLTAARATPSASRKKQKVRSNWPSAGTKGKGEGEDDVPEDEVASAFVEGGLETKRTRGPAKGKVDVKHKERPFAIKGSGAEAFFGSLGVTDKATLHKVLYESGYVWTIASFGDAPWNADETKPCQLRDVLEYLAPLGVYKVGDKACSNRKVWLAAHMWPTCNVLEQNKISCLTGGQQSLLKKYVTGINQVTHFFNEYMQRIDEGFRPIATSAPAPSRKAVKRPRKDDDERMPEAVSDDVELVD